MLFSVVYTLTVVGRGRLVVLPAMQPAQEEPAACLVQPTGCWNHPYTTTTQTIKTIDQPMVPELC